jgi:predicted HD phosphohydrolase
MTEGTQQDWAIIAQAMGPFIFELPDRVLAHLKMLAGDCGGFAIKRLQHSLQTATRAYKDGGTKSMSSAPCCTTWATF